MTVQEWLGEDNKLGIDIWEKKYRQNNESFNEWLDRISGSNDKIRELIVQKKFYKVFLEGCICTSTDLYESASGAIT